VAEEPIAAIRSGAGGDPARIAVPNYNFGALNQHTLRRKAGETLTSARRLFIKNDAESVLVVAKQPTMHLSAITQFSLTPLAIVRPNTGDFGFVYSAMFRLL
jgi:hypothetical protein